LFLWDLHGTFPILTVAGLNLLEGAEPFPVEPVSFFFGNFMEHFPSLTVAGLKWAEPLSQ